MYPKVRNRLPESDVGSSDRHETTSTDTADYITAENQIAYVVTDKEKTSWKESSFSYRKLYKSGYRGAYTPIPPDQIPPPSTLTSSMHQGLEMSLRTSVHGRTQQIGSGSKGSVAVVSHFEAQPQDMLGVEADKQCLSNHIDRYTASEDLEFLYKVLSKGNGTEVDEWAATRAEAVRGRSFSEPSTDLLGGDRIYQPIAVSKAEFLRPHPPAVEIESSLAEPRISIASLSVQYKLETGRHRHSEDSEILAGSIQLPQVPFPFNEARVSTSPRDDAIPHTENKEAMSGPRTYKAGMGNPAVAESNLQEEHADDQIFEYPDPELYAIKPEGYYYPVSPTRAAQQCTATIAPRLAQQNKSETLYTHPPFLGPRLDQNDLNLLARLPDSQTHSTENVSSPAYIDGPALRHSLQLQRASLEIQSPTLQLQRASREMQLATLQQQAASLLPQSAILAQSSQSAVQPASYSTLRTTDTKLARQRPLKIGPQASEGMRQFIKDFPTASNPEVRQFLKDRHNVDVDIQTVLRRRRQMHIPSIVRGRPSKIRGRR